MPREGKPKRGLKVESLQLLARTEGLAETSQTKKGLKVRGGVGAVHARTISQACPGIASVSCSRGI